MNWFEISFLYGSRLFFHVCNWNVIICSCKMFGSSSCPLRQARSCLRSSQQVTNSKIQKVYMSWHRIKCSITMRVSVKETQLTDRLTNGQKKFCLFVCSSNEKFIATSITIWKLCGRSSKWHLVGCSSFNFLEMALEWWSRIWKFTTAKDFHVWFYCS